jgi:hypothetical protein
MTGVCVCVCVCVCHGRAGSTSTCSDYVDACAHILTIRHTPYTVHETTFRPRRRQSAYCSRLSLSLSSARQKTEQKCTQTHKHEARDLAFDTSMLAYMRTATIDAATALAVVLAKRRGAAHLAEPALAVVLTDLGRIAALAAFGAHQVVHARADYLLLALEAIFERALVLANLLFCARATPSRRRWYELAELP